MLCDKQPCPWPDAVALPCCSFSFDPIKHRKCHEPVCLSSLLLIFVWLFLPCFRDHFPSCRTPRHVFEKPATCPMEQPAARNAYYSKCDSLSVDSVQAKPSESRISSRHRRRRERSTIRPVEARVAHTAPAVWSSWSRGQHPCNKLFCRVRYPASEVPEVLCGQKSIHWPGYLLGSLGDSSPLLPWLSVEDGLPSLLSLPSLPQHFTSLCLCEHIED